jgi:tellurite resistance protein
MKRLTLGATTCAETLTLLISIAWADGNLADEEKEGVRAAAGALNLTKERRAQLEQSLEKAPAIEKAALGKLSSRDQGFAYVAATWMARIDGTVAEGEQELLDEIAAAMKLDDEQREKLEALAAELEPREKGASWATEIEPLFKAILPKVADVTEEVEISFE